MIDQDVTDQDVIEQDVRKQEVDPRDVTEFDGAERSEVAEPGAPALPVADGELTDGEPATPAGADDPGRSTMDERSNGNVRQQHLRDLPDHSPASDDSHPADESRPADETRVVDDGEQSTAAAPVSTGRRPRSGVTRQQLEEEGDIAADYLEELLDIVDLDGDIDIDVENDRAAISIIGDGVAQRSLKRLVGDGEVLEAVQELTRLAVQTKTGERSRLMLDIARFRAHRKEELEQVAREAITRQRENHVPVHLDPMTPFERKVVHDVVATEGLRSESEGDGDSRHVVITAVS